MLVDGEVEAVERAAGAAKLETGAEAPFVVTGVSELAGAVARAAGGVGIVVAVPGGEAAGEVEVGGGAERDAGAALQMAEREALLGDALAFLLDDAGQRPARAVTAAAERGGAAPEVGVAGGTP